MSALSAGFLVHQSLQAFNTYSKCSAGISWRWWHPSSLYLSHQIRSWTHLAQLSPHSVAAHTHLHVWAHTKSITYAHIHTHSNTHTHTPAVVDYQRTSAVFSDFWPVFDGLTLDVTQHKSTGLVIITYNNTGCFASCVHWWQACGKRELWKMAGKSL